MRLPSESLERESGSGARNVFNAASQSSRVTRAMSASPGIVAVTSPFLSARASMVIKTLHTTGGSRQIVEVIIEEKSLVYPGTPSLPFPPPREFNMCRY